MCWPLKVKSSLTVADVKKFVADLGAVLIPFFPNMPPCSFTVRVAGIGIESEADVYASRQGLFVLAESGRWRRDSQR